MALILKVEYIKNWLSENEINLHYKVQETNCRKWTKWMKDKSTHIYPCVCPIREQECIFIETYYKLEKIILLHSRESYFRELIQLHMQAGTDNDKILEWFSHYKEEFDGLDFNEIISITVRNKPYKTEKFNLDKMEFNNVIEFQRIFIDILYKQNN